LSAEGRILLFLRAAGWSRPIEDDPKVTPSAENKALPEPGLRTKVTICFGEASAMIRNDCVIRDQTKLKELTRGK
jgi:hypothetical protein